MSLARMLWWLTLVPVVLAAAPPPVPVIVATVGSRQIADRIEALGTLRANESVELTAAVTETVTAIHFDDGDRVEAGAVLVEMTSAEEHAQLEEARVLVEEANKQFRRVESLAAQGTVARSQLDERRREWDAARARLVAIESRLADRLVKAPFAGIVGLRNISVGALVEPGDLITTLDDDRRMKLDFPVPSSRLELLHSGLEVVARARAFADREFRGEVRTVDSRVDPVTRSVVVRAVVPNPDGRLKPGMLMTVELIGNPREALMIPEAALVPRGESQRALVVGGESKVVQRALQIGARVPGWVEVLDGLAHGERVVTHGTTRVKPGDSVRVLAVDDGSRAVAEILREAGGS